MNQFDGDKLVKEVHEITEVLCKIKAGRLTQDSFEGLHLDDNIYKQGLNFAGNEDYGDEYGEYYDYGMEYEDEGEYRQSKF